MIMPFFPYVHPCTYGKNEFRQCRNIVFVWNRPHPCRFCVFGTDENKDIMIEFVSLVTNLRKDDFDDVRIENTEQIPHFYKDKTGWLDIKICLNDGRKIDVEMSFSDRHPCLSENTSFAFQQNIASARNHRHPWRYGYGKKASTNRE